MSEPITLADARALMAENDAGRFIKHQMAAAQRAAAHRRALVLRHPDLAERLTQPPLRHTTPEHWNGYIPPTTDCTGAINTTACRPVLLALVAEAEARSATAQNGQAA
ncbi:hypothetical protein ACWD25_15435 [Streptomyces sp. NPDC002920]